MRFAIAAPVGLLAALLSRGVDRRVGRDVPAIAALGTPGAIPGRVILRGRVLLPDDGSPVGLRAHITTVVRADSVDVDLTGTFSFSLPTRDCDSAEIRIDARDGFPRRYHEARVRVAMPPSRDAADEETLRIVLVPTAYTIAGGTYGGTVVSISVDAALAPPGERARYWRVSRSATSRGVPIGWPDEGFPLPVAVAGRSSAMRRVDSAAFWTIARQLERDFGRTLFRPISIDSARSEGSSVSLSLDPGEDTPGITFITHDGHANLFDASIVIRTSLLLTDERVVTHELMHALGFGHAVGWYSVMNSPFQASSRATANDVAYAQLLYRMRRMFIEQRATHGILESTDVPRTRGINACGSAHPPADARGERGSLLETG